MRLFSVLPIKFSRSFLHTAAVVTLNEVWIRSHIDAWLSNVRTSSFLLEQDAIVTATNARAVFGQEVMARFMRDLHLYSRTAGWLLFGAVSRSAAFTKSRTGAEECKTYRYPPDPKDGDPICPFMENEIPCDCDWDDNFATNETCSDYDDYGLGSSRYVQTGTFEGQRSNINPLTGDRPRTFNRTYVYTGPSDTSWWDSYDLLPGSDKGDAAAGFETTYDRVRVLSAISAVEFPMYNYFPGRDENVHLGAYIGMEADGMVRAQCTLTCHYHFSN